jgi:uracil-DNA glycosylase family 4
MLNKPSSCFGCPLYGPPYGKQWGYVPADGSGENGVLIILEAAGEDEEQCGKPVVGKAGQFMWMHLKSVGIEREGFRIHNVLSCRPPENKLLKMPYTEAAIESCSPNLDTTIVDHVRATRERDLTPVIVALGKFSFRRLLGVMDHHPIMRADYFTYPHWLEQYGCWLLAAPHPSHIMQGKNNLVPTMQFVFQRALEIASEGLELEDHDYLLDPSPIEFRGFVDEYYEQLELNFDGVYLSYDIETPYKSGKSEDEVAREDDDDYIILRCGYSFNLPDGSTRSCSARWQPEYMAEHERLFASTGFGVNWNGSTYDDVRIRQQVRMNLVSLDAMLAWHVLNTSLPKGLGYVTPFYVKNTSMWKHLATPPKGMPLEEASRQEAFYNAKDADMALRNWFGIKQDLVDNKLWDIFDRHVVQLNKVLSYMSGQGVLLDKVARQEAEDKLQGLLAEIWKEMQAVVPVEAKRLKVFKKEPKDVTGLVRTTDLRKATRCPICHTLDVRSDHFKSVGKKRLKAGDQENPCSGAKADKVEIPDLLWAEPLPFKISKTSLTAYQKVRNHQPFKDRKTKQPTFDIKAIKSLINKYPDDKLYPIIGTFRKVQKLASTYVGVTQYKEITVDDDYQLQPGEFWADDPAALPQGGSDIEQGWENSDDLCSQSIDVEASEPGTELTESA